MYIDTRGAICITTLSNPHKCSSHVDSHNKDKMIEIRSVHCKQTQTDMRKAESFPELKLSITRKLQKGCMQNHCININIKKFTLVSDWDDILYLSRIGQFGDIFDL